MSYTPIKIETAKHQTLKQLLLANWPDCDEETLQDTLEGITDLHEMIAAAIRSALEQIQVFPIPEGIPKSSEQCESSIPWGWRGTWRELTAKTCVIV